MKSLLALLIIAAPALAHVVSLSSGDLTVEGAHARYELRMPLYEIGHVSDPARALLAHVRFLGAATLFQSCAPAPSRGLYICRAEYAFPNPPRQIEIECTLASITVPSHVHMLHGEMDGRRDEAVFDIGFPRATLRFRPPAAAEIAVEQSIAGMMRALGGPVQILFLAALALAARSRRELTALAGMFVAGEVAAVLAMRHAAWQPAPRFVEAAAALTLAYLAVELLLLPRAGSSRARSARFTDSTSTCSCRIPATRPAGCWRAPRRRNWRRSRCSR
ncbi:MAG TPA: hypothetical protein VKX45_09105 [Bryobacteraceae bacterium]|nr:hypothetical protein [Bryobacteraceae bacterium]